MTLSETPAYDEYVKFLESLRKHRLDNDQRLRIGVATKPYDNLKNHDELIKLRKDCIDIFVSYLGSCSDVAAKYFDDIQTAAKAHDFRLLDLLLDTTVQLPLLSPTIDIFLLKFFIKYWSHHEENELHTKVLFEQVLDTADYDLEDYVDILNDLFELDKPSIWFNDMYDQINKLKSLAPMGKRKFEVLKKGLKIAEKLPSRDLFNELSDFLRHHYVKGGYANNDLEWIAD
jgi:hypothetical protein